MTLEQRMIKTKLKSLLFQLEDNSFNWATAWAHEDHNERSKILKNQILELVGLTDAK